MSAFPQVALLDHDIRCIDVEMGPPGVVCCYLVGSGQGADSVYAFVDCGTSLTAPRLLRVLDEAGIAREAVRYVLPTHVHLDHAGGAGALMRALPLARLVAHPRAARHLIDPSRLIEGASAVYGADGMREMYGGIVPVDASRVLIAEDGYTIDLGGRALEFIDAPGHARHHYTIWDVRSRGWFCGDSFGLSYPQLSGPQGPFVLPTSSPVQFDPEAWPRTIGRLLARDPQWMYLTHFGRVGAVPRLAADLLRGIADYARMARSMAELPDRGAQLRSALFAHEFTRLHDAGSPLPEAAARAALEMDVELNAQGLEVWLEHASGDAVR